MPEGMSWGLKQCGYLFVLDSVERLGATKILEIGPGFNLYLEHKLGAEIELESLDDAGFYTPELFSAIRAQDRRGPYHLGLLGKDHNLKPETYDACVSVSALEHVPARDIKAVARDMFALTRPGGWSIHSIDCKITTVAQVAQAWAAAFEAAGFETPAFEPDSLFTGAVADGGPLLESTAILFRFHFGYQRDAWARSLRKDAIEAAGTVLFRLRRPLEG